jgi:hypothetical protein
MAGETPIIHVFPWCGCQSCGWPAFANHDELMPEVTHAGEHHRNTGGVRCRDHFLVA